MFTCIIIVNLILILNFNSFTGMELLFFLTSAITYIISTQFLDLDDDNADYLYYEEKKFYLSTIGWAIFIVLLHYGFYYMFKIFVNEEEIPDPKKSALEEEYKYMLEGESADESFNLNICK